MVFSEKDKYDIFWDRRARDILKVINFEAKKVKLIAKETDLPIATVYRILAILETNNLVVTPPFQFNADRGKYRSNVKEFRVSMIDGITNVKCVLRRSVNDR